MKQNKWSFFIQPELKNARLSMMYIWKVSTTNIMMICLYVDDLLIIDSHSLRLRT